MATPTHPDDELVGVPAPGDPSGPSPTYRGRPTFSTGAEKASSLEEAHKIAALNALHDDEDEV